MVYFIPGGDGTGVRLKQLLALQFHSFGLCLLQCVVFQIIYVQITYGCVLLCLAQVS